MNDVHSDIREKMLEVLEYGAEEGYELDEVLDTMDGTVSEIKRQAALRSMRNFHQGNDDDD